MLVFIKRQVKQLREGGWTELRRKLELVLRALARFPVLLIAFMPDLLVVLTVRLIRPVFLIRFQRLTNWRIGHFAANVELYLCELDAGINRPETNFLDIWYHPCKPCNRQLTRMWDRVLHIGPRWLLEPVIWINALIPGGSAHLITGPTANGHDVHNLLDRFPPHLAFLPEEERRGEEGLRALGIPEGAPFVCFHVRDSAYLSSQSPHLDWSRHDHRDCNVQNYVVAARKLVERGYYVIRMGAVVKEAMAVDHPMIIDYATNGMRSDFMDIYLGAKCAFCVSNGSGFDSVPYIFRRPSVYVDMVPAAQVHTFSTMFLSVIKKHWSRKEGRFMTLREIFDSGAGDFLLSNQFDDAGIDLLESTPEEIAAVVLEMEERLRGSWKSTEEDERLQRQFWELFPNSESRGEIRSRIGADFLRLHRDCLR